LKAQCPILPVEPYTPNANYAEGAIRELKRLFRRQMAAKHIHEAFWDSCLVYCAKTRFSCCLNIPELKGQTPLTYLTGEPTDISHLAEFGYFDMVWFISHEGPDSIQVKWLDQYRGLADTVGGALCAMVGDERLIEFHRTSVFPLSQEDKWNPKVQKNVGTFDRAMLASLDKKYSLKNSKWKLNKDYIAEESDAPTHYDNEEITPEMFQKLSIHSDDTATPAATPLPDAEDIKMGYDNYISANRQGDWYYFLAGCSEERNERSNGCV
jgi:hypothetical protein